MKKLTLILALAFTTAAINSFAGDKDKGLKDTKHKPGKMCTKKSSDKTTADKEKSQ